MLFLVGWLYCGVCIVICKDSPPPVCFLYLALAAFVNLSARIKQINNYGGGDWIKQLQEAQVGMRAKAKKQVSKQGKGKKVCARYARRFALNSTAVLKARLLFADPCKTKQNAEIQEQYTC